MTLAVADTVGNTAVEDLAASLSTALGTAVRVDADGTPLADPASILALIDAGVAGIHFYVLNKSQATAAVLRAVDRPT